MGTHVTENELVKRHGEGTRVLSIGPAGENMVPFACLTAELYRQAGRGGVGAAATTVNPVCHMALPIPYLAWKYKRL